MSTAHDRPIYEKIIKIVLRVCLAIISDYKKCFLILDENF